MLQIAVIFINDHQSVLLRLLIITIFKNVHFTLVYLHDKASIIYIIHRL